MNKNDYTDFKFLSKLFLKFKDKKLRSFDKRIQSLKQNIEIQEKQLEQNKTFLQKIIIENNSLKNDYNDILRLFENENKTIFIRNKDYDISQWENVFIKKNANNYYLQTKKNQVVFAFEESMNDFISFLLTLNYSIIVTSIDKNRIALQIRINKL